MFFNSGDERALKRRNSVRRAKSIRMMQNKDEGGTKQVDQFLNMLSTDLKKKWFRNKHIHNQTNYYIIKTWLKTNVGLFFKWNIPQIGMKLRLYLKNFDNICHITILHYSTISKMGFLDDFLFTSKKKIVFFICKTLWKLYQFGKNLNFRN